jgi:hypothetical protein
MENKNVTTNLLIKQLLQSDNMAYAPGYISSKVDIEFGVLNKAYQDTGKEYAKLKTSMDQGKCGDCIKENNRLTQIENSPKLSLEFLENIMGELAVTQTSSYDPNNYFGFLVSNCIITKKPGFSRTDGYDIELNLLDNGTQEITFSGPVFDKPLIINSAALQSLLDSDTSMVVATPDINISMTELLVESQLFTPDNVGENGQLSSAAKISDEFVLKFNGEPDYEILDIGNGKGRNILRFDMDKIERKIQPFINAEVAGLLSTEQEAIAAWNVYLSKGTSSEEDDQMVQNANAGEDSWIYEKDLPLYQDKKIKFAEKYKQYFYKNYLKQFLENKLPSVEEDAAIFDLEEARKAKAQKLMGNQ